MLHVETIGGLCPFRHAVKFWAPPTRKFYTSVRPRQQSINALRRAKVISRPSTNGGGSDRKMDFSFFALSLLLLSKDANFLARVPFASLSAFLPFRAFHQERRTVATAEMQTYVPPSPLHKFLAMPPARPSKKRRVARPT